MKSSPQATSQLSIKHDRFLRQLFSEGYVGGRYKNPRWLREDLHRSYQTTFGSMSGFSQMLDELVSSGFIGMKATPSGFLVEYTLPRGAIAYLASKDTLAADSSKWTGLKSQATLDGETAEALVSALRTIDTKLETLNLSNSERSAIRSYVLAAKILADGPSPPADLIWEIVDRADKIAGIVGLFIGIFALLAAGAR